VIDNKTRTIDLDALVLLAGGHKSLAEGACLLEAISHIAGERWSASPRCVDPTLAAFGRSWNDALDDKTRQRLKIYIPRLIGTAGSAAISNRRAWMATDWASRVSAPTWLRRAGLVEEAAALEALPEIVDSASAAHAQGALNRARTMAGAARDAARDAALGAAYDAALGAAYDAALGAALGAALDAALDAARGAALGAALGAAYDAARDAALGAALDAALGAALGAAYDAALGAAYDAALGALKETVARLQESAFDLLDRMIECGSEVAA
jgi:hypothetical protein